MKRLAIGIAALAVALAACGGGDGGTAGGASPSPLDTIPVPTNGQTTAGTGRSPDATASPGEAVEIEAEDIAFEQERVTAPAGTPWQIEFENRDENVPHNVSIYRTQDFQDLVFRGEVFNGVETRIYQVPAIEAGTYYFRCDVHPEMQGTVVAE